MALRMLIFFVTYLIIIPSSEARKPAVEDFIGIEVEESKTVPRGSEVLFDLEQDIHKIQNNKNTQNENKISKNDSETFSNAFWGILFAMMLPAIIWFSIMNHIRKKATLETASNIEVLERYRREREKKSEENSRKAS